MSHTINHSKLKQKGLTITLIDLKNAFGEVNHNVIHSVLQYHHVPNDVCPIMQNLYSVFHLAVITKNFTCNLIKVKRGVLQGDSFSLWRLTRSFNLSNNINSLTSVTELETDSSRGTGSSLLTMLLPSPASKVRIC